MAQYRTDDGEVVEVVGRVQELLLVALARKIISLTLMHQSQEMPQKLSMTEITVVMLLIECKREVTLRQ